MVSGRFFIIGILIALWGTVLAFAGGKLQRGELVLSAERSVYATFILLSLASAGVIVAFVTDRFDFWYVASYSNRELETFFKGRSGTS